MHEDLQGKNINPLPLLYRVYASNAANGSLVDLRKLLSLVLKNPPGRTELLLPLDSVTEHASAITRAALVLEGLSWCTLWWLHGIPEEVALEFWPRIWSWIHFLDIYEDLVRSIIPLSLKESYEGYAGLMLNYQWHPRTAHLPHNTRGVRVVVARAWGLILRFERGVHERRFTHIVHFLADNLESARPESLQDFPTGETSALFLWGLIRLLVECDDRDGPLNRALINHGIIESVARLLCIYPGVPVKGKDKLISDLFTILVNKIDAFPSYPGVAESFRSLNLLWAIDLSDGTAAVPGLAFRIQKSIPQNEALFYLDPFPDQQLLAAWKTLVPGEDTGQLEAAIIGRCAGGRKSAAVRLVIGQIIAPPHVRLWTGVMVNIASSALASERYPPGRYQVFGLLQLLTFQRRSSNGSRALLSPRPHTPRLRALHHVLCLQKIAFMHARRGDQYYLVLDYTKVPQTGEVHSVGIGRPRTQILRTPRARNGKTKSRARPAAAGAWTQLWCCSRMGGARIGAWRHFAVGHRRCMMDCSVDRLIQDRRDSGEDRVEWNQLT
ncbi:hypothetical protein B0H14DRAFT_3143269, partial [Mycena olivaceomarginata]